MPMATGLRPVHLVMLLAGVALLAVGFASAAQAQDGPTVQVGGNDELGDFLVGPDQMTLYIFEMDEAGVSNCTGDCASAWPPLTVAEGEEPTAGDGVEGTLDTIERDDGSLQVTLDGQPLYYWASDEEPGDATGQGVQDVWFVVEVSAASDDDNGTDGDDSPSAPASGTGLATGGDSSVVDAGLLAAAGAVLIAGGAGLGFAARRK